MYYFKSGKGLYFVIGFILEYIIIQIKCFKEKSLRYSFQRKTPRQIQQTLLTSEKECKRPA